MTLPGKCLKVARFVIIFSMFCLWSEPGLGQQQESQLVCDEPVYDFGTRNNVDQLEHTFVLRNKGTTPFVIRKVNGCCGVTAELTGDKIIQPGSNTTVLAKITLGGYDGKYRKVVHVLTEGQILPVYRLMINGIVIPLVEVHPGAVTFNCSFSNSVMESKMVITSRDGNPFSVTGVVSSVPQCAIDSYTNIGKNKCEIALKTVPPIPSGVIQGYLQVYTDNKAFPVIKPYVVILLADDVMVVPDKLILKPLSAGTNSGPNVYSVIVCSRSKQKFQITNIIPPFGDIVTTITPVDDCTYRCDFSNVVSSLEIAGAYMEIFVKQENERKIVVPIDVPLPATAHTGVLFDGTKVVR